MLNVGVVGGSGFTGGELLRLLLGHPEVRIHQVTSRGYAGKPLGRAHPNMRGISDLRFVAPDTLDSCDVLFLCLPHGQSATGATNRRSRTRTTPRAQTARRTRSKTQQSVLNVGIVGGSGFTGGELLRLLLGHPEIRIHQVTSRGYAGKPRDVTCRIR